MDNTLSGTGFINILIMLLLRFMFRLLSVVSSLASKLYLRSPLACYDFLTYRSMETNLDRYIRARKKKKKPRLGENSDPVSERV
ncbi:hypothetical protein B0H19DRAFT_1113465 [Mycena capillaripes]|nr:hypothetical protein B0H19DRAFT_1113465 [Mycena capillaripes]